MQASAIIVAAGQGTRFGSELPKQFLLLCGRPILAHTLLRFEQAEQIGEVVLVAAGGWQAYIEQEIIRRFQIKKCRRLVSGGKHRQDSVWAGLQALHPPADSLVVVHDAVRPLFTPDLLARVLAGCGQAEGCIPGLPPKDTVKQISAQEIIRTVDRETLRLAQTPQVFRASALQQAFQRARMENFYATDEAGLIEHMGGKVVWVEGEEKNLKITTPGDLQIAELFARELGACA
ncbi:MAG: 2-C-methyl-D-erythritol 4-phosphate cytidylyltransferase [candidate division KSB1 bacterium]|nr:2-C-methyl-D-erythritol 4-phosphate cytidylyltransferase [candidate division KSB1 bacterium]MDZ7276168.1 2-C-methyl-D-erythritol 4-phosphate cytidylyltransferase [candidate division KSB1 bacterium]MDZ7287052.1 2-C-methyl-D-erythritol 4-phosphate cytidylyltransferase [candidate division KSB1 bacterium]MDZ7297023.1 2-C-methyl-D-erythritol 4-phosphate cytidylyltransferase [candidate division KSB1 bacterium]MDZ7307529.1 2-C-methyl-D-erythritol 4-phosphate cytidylyltransferase [candidate division